MRQARRFATTAPGWLRQCYALPLLLPVFLGISDGTPEGFVFALAILALAFVYLLAWPGRLYGLLLSFVLWIGLLYAIGSLGASSGITVLTVLAVVATGVAAVLVTVGTVRIGTPWGWQRYDRRAARGRPLIEWEWVYTGPAFARQHRLSQSHGPVYFVIAAVLFFGGGQLFLGWLTLLGAWNVWQAGLAGIAAMSGLTLLLFLGTCACLLTAFWLLRRNTAAWYPTWVFLILGFPVTLPLIVYWADGVRPNLVYRHRFERLVRPKPGPET